MVLKSLIGIGDVQIGGHLRDIFSEMLVSCCYSRKQQLPKVPCMEGHASRVRNPRLIVEGIFGFGVGQKDGALAEGEKPMG